MDSTKVIPIRPMLMRLPGLPRRSTAGGRAGGRGGAPPGRSLPVPGGSPVRPSPSQVAGRMIRPGKPGEVSSSNLTGRRGVRDPGPGVPGGLPVPSGREARARDSEAVGLPPGAPGLPAPGPVGLPEDPPGRGLPAAGKAPGTPSGRLGPPCLPAPSARGLPAEPSARDRPEVPSARGLPAEPSGRGLPEEPSGRGLPAPGGLPDLPVVPPARGLPAPAEPAPP
ncbi:hypothetical protein [Streptosporangium sp. NPDC051022]|uniref:hypothetical protein n=1 Tax=Streptosporangium sp. NPDC051022 TaxID=3155752 RepID=UPI003438F238